jgi:hypothetical protein
LDAFSGEIHSASCELKENDKTQRDERYKIMYAVLCFSWYIFGGSLASLGTHEHTPLHITWSRKTIFLQTFPQTPYPSQTHKN